MKPGLMRGCLYAFAFEIAFALAVWALKVIAETLD